jgi:hypothetical protein
LICLGSWQSSEHASGLSIIVPLILLLCLSFSESRVIRSTVLSDIFHFFALSFASSVSPPSSIPLVSLLSQWGLRRSWSHYVMAVKGQFREYITELSSWL